MKQARYDGAYLEVDVYDPETGNQKVVDTVQRGGFLSPDVPERIRDDLFLNGEWSAWEVDPVTGEATALPLEEPVPPEPFERVELPEPEVLGDAAEPEVVPESTDNGGEF